ncbi:hypothetical protein JCM10207_008653 [Rhodosporidiobolus poonsookiae]
MASPPLRPLPTPPRGEGATRTAHLALLDTDVDPTPSTSASLSPSSPALPARQTPSPTLRKRVLPKYTYSDGDWIEDTGWTLRGSAAAASPSPTSASHAASMSIDSGAADDEGLDEHVEAHVSSAAPTAMHDYLDNLASPTSSSPSSTLTPAPSPSPTAAYDTAPSASTSSVNIPDGWQPRPRETDYYAVPIIIAMSVLVAIIVVGAIFATVFVRRKNRRRRNRKRGIVEESKWRAVVEKVVPGAAARGRRRGRRGSAGAAAKERSASAVAAATRAGGEEQRRDEPRQDGGADEGAGSGSGGGGSGHRRVRTTGFAAGPRVRPRRRRRRDADPDDEDDEGTALTRTQTRSSTSSSVRDTLTARLAARFRSERESGAGAGDARPSGPVTVFSRDVGASSHSLTASALALTRASSRTSVATGRSSASAPSPVTPTTPTPAPQLLFTPADDPSLQPQPHIPGSGSPSLSRLYTTHSRASSRSSLALASSSAAPQPPPQSAFGALIATDALPAPGPPAYRASSSTVQQTRRFGAGDAAPEPVSPVVGTGAGGVMARFGGRRRVGRRRAEDEGESDEGEWHWPGEKGRPLGLAPDSASEVEAPLAGPSGSAPPPHAHDDPDDARHPALPPPVDRSLFSAHVATDDKAVLARLRARTDRLDRSEGAALVPSAPPIEHQEAEDGDAVDEDGFERFSGAEAGAEAGPSAPPPNLQRSPSILPAPPARVQYAYLSSSAPSPALATPALASLSAAALLPSTPAPASAQASSAGQEKAALAAEYAAAGLADDDGEDGEEAEGAWLPRYGVPTAPAVQASAPPVLDNDEEDEEEEAALALALEEGLRRSAGEREEHGVV